MDESDEEWGLLDEKDEAELHKHRLLNVEEKPFKRITKRLGTLSALLSSAQQPAATAAARQQQQQQQLRDQLREEITLDFAAFDSSLERLQLLLGANEQERARYRVDQGRILAACDTMRARNDALRAQLVAARATLAERKQLDALADRITANRALRPRTEQHAALAALRDEITDLEREGAAYDAILLDGRAQFARLVDDIVQLRARIVTETRDVNRGAQPDDDADTEAGPDADAGADAAPDIVAPPPLSPLASAAGASIHGDDARTPRHSPGGLRPMSERAAGSVLGSVRGSVRGSVLGSASQLASREPSPRLGAGTAASEQENGVEEGEEEEEGERGEDVEMADATELDSEGKHRPYSVTAAAAAEESVPTAEADTMAVDDA